jgi:DNA polymerase-1
MVNESVGNPPKKLLLIDGHAVAFYSWFTSYPNEVIPGFFGMLENSIRKHTPTHVIVTFDPPPPTFRHKLYPCYKANRPPAPKKLLEDCELVRERLELLGVISCTVDGYEADDLLGTLCHTASGSGFETTILTSDLDLLQLVTPITQVEVFSQYWATRLFGPTAAKVRFGGIEPKNIPDYKALVGDKSDNLPGVPGIGEVSAEAVLGRFADLDNTYKHLGEVSELPIRGAKRVSKLLSDHRAQAFLMRTLTTIVCNVPLAVDLHEARFSDSSAQISSNDFKA